jgi:uncharacterized membrane protein YraQ (UPF0718 family)
LKKNKKKKGKVAAMVIPTVILGVLAVVLLYVGYAKGQGQHITGLKLSMKMTIQILPLIVFAFIVAGMVQVLVPQELLSRWIGAESGLRGILIGTMVAFLTGWSLWAVSRLPLEVGIMGWRFTAIRLVCTFFFPPIAGLMAQAFFGAPK